VKRWLCKLGFHNKVSAPLIVGPKTGTVYVTVEKCTRCPESWTTDHYFGCGVSFRNIEQSQLEIQKMLDAAFGRK
jgi:hypothetical protein